LFAETTTAKIWRTAVNSISQVCVLSWFNIQYIELLMHCIAPGKIPKLRSQYRFGYWTVRLQRHFCMDERLLSRVLVRALRTKCTIPKLSEYGKHRPRGYP
jgi:hypothetical protein